jgi:NAD(P)-dependent dehydrogenase (short-subunit alcohol dehydrogenase family)
METEVAVVTGGAGGLGQLIAQRLAQRGFVVAIADIDCDAAAELTAELAEQGSRALFIETDASNADDIRRLMAEVASLGALKILINNSGGWLAGSQFPESDQWPRCLDLNLLMPMLAAQLAVPLMSSRGGTIVNISSSAGLASQAYGSPEYGAAKAGLIRFTTSVADWVERYHIRVNCVVPHWIGLARAIREFEQMTERDRVNSGGLVDPQVVADTVVDLALDQSSAGRIVVLRAHRDPYDVDPASPDPQEGSVDKLSR